MKMLQPVAITDTNFVSSNVPEDEVEWAGGPVSKGDRRRVGHDVYESLEDSNSQDPTIGVNADPPTWGLVGKTNRWTMFDTTRETSIRTQNPDSIATEIDLAEPATLLVLLGIEGGSVDVVLTDEQSVEVYNQNHPTQDASHITDLWLYLNEYPERETRLAISDLPSVAGRLSITINNPSGVAECGLLAFGVDYQPGKTQWDMESRLVPAGGGRKRDAFGRLVFQPQKVYREVSFSVLLPTDGVDYLERRIQSLAAAPLVVVGSERYANTIIFGAIKGTPTTRPVHRQIYSVMKYVMEEM